MTKIRISYTLMVEELRAKYIFLQLFFRYTDNETFFLSPFTWSFLMYIFKIFSQLKNMYNFFTRKHQPDGLKKRNK